MTQSAAVLNETSVPINELLAARWSPSAFDPEHTISREDLTAIFEAARWAPSAANKQPWKFYAAVRGSETFAKIVDALAPWNTAWAPRASALVIALAEVRRDGEEQTTAIYDLGQAVGHLTVEAASRGFSLRQGAGSDEAKLRETLGFSSDYTLLSTIAIGVHDDSEQVPPALIERESNPRERRPLDEIATIDA